MSPAFPALSSAEQASFAGLVLAGGEGRRFGCAKAWASLPDGRTFLEACRELLDGAGADPIVATLPPAALGPLPEGIAVTRLPERDLDMFTSTQIGLERLLEDITWRAVVVLPVDHPLISSTTVQLLIAAGPPAAIPSLAGRHGHPVCLWREVAMEVVSGELAGPTLREVLTAVGARSVPVDDPGIRANCNSPEALAEALARIGG